MSNTPALDRWKAQLSAWAIPDEIRKQAPAFPWHLDPELFRPLPGTGEGSLATRRAREALADGAVVLDVGCGGGAASLALADRAGSVIGADESAEMLELYTAEATSRDLEVITVPGRWPDSQVSSELGADVVVCHHVAYNVAALDEFAHALDRATKPGGRVVMELTLHHPQTVNAPLWRHFWNIERPTGPSADDAHAVLIEAGIDATFEVGEAGQLRRESPPETRAAGAARMLCLGPDRVQEVDAQIRSLPARSTERAVIWWDTATQSA